MTAVILGFAYRLRHHRLGEWSLDRWGVAIPLLVAAAILLRWFIAGMPDVPATHWGFLALLATAPVGMLYLGRWARRRMYVVFDPEGGLDPPTPARLDPADKVLVHSTGEFEVEGKSQFFADLLAYWRSFASREHSIMAIVHSSRFLLLFRTPEEDLGMWYVFFRPEMIEGITPGVVTFGRSRRQALRVFYRYTPPANSKRKPPRPVMRVIYLGFADEAARRQVWADMLGDNAE